jgi:hypothetical protein
MQIWAGGMPKNFLSYCAARASLSLTHVQCLPILRDCCLLSHTLQDCGTKSGRGLFPTGQPHGPAKLGLNRQTSTLKLDATGEPLHIQQAAQIRAFRAAG